MHKNHSKYLAVSLSLLILVSATLFFLTHKEERADIDPAYFAVTNTEQIDHVQLVSPKDTVDLIFDGSRWTVNGQWEADMQMIKVLMATLRQAAPHRPVAAVLTDSITKQLLLQGTRVMLSEGGQPRMSFFAGGNSDNTESWFLKEGDDQPYIMIIPGYRVYVSGILQLNAGGWRNKRIFDFNWRNFKSLTANYTNEPKEGFSVEMRQRYFGIRELVMSDTTKLNDYLDAVSLLMATRFIEPRDAAALSAMRQGPVAHIEIKDIADRTYTLDLFLPGDKSAEVFGRMTGGQLVTIDRDAVSSIARRRAYFVAADH